MSPALHRRKDPPTLISPKNAASFGRRGNETNKVKYLKYSTVEIPHTVKHISSAYHSLEILIRKK